MIELKPTVKNEHKGKVGLLKKKDGSIIYDDSWMHMDLDDDYGVIEKSMRSLNKTKLVQKRVAVKGKDGKIFYRMQWVDPTKDMITSDAEGVEQEDTTKRQKPINEADAKFYIDLNEEEQRGNKEDFQVHSDMEWRDLVSAITDKLKTMPVDDKIDLMKKAGIDNPDYSDRIGWMKNVQKLKWYLRENPHLIDLDNVPKKDSTPDNIDSLQDVLNKSTDESIYALIKKLGIADEDPRKNPNYSEKNAGIRHFNNLMRLKMKLKADKSLVKELESKNTISNSKEKNIIQNNGHNITTVLNSMSREDKYKLMKVLGINDGTDPMYNPAFLANNIHAKMHMEYMMKLKRQLELNPSLLNNADTKVNNPVKKDEISNLTSVRNMLKSCSKELKESLLYEYRNHPTLVNIEKSNNKSVNWMRSMMALTEILAEDDNYSSFESKHKKDSDYNHKFINKDIEKFLRGMANIKGERAQVYQIEKGIEWGFGEESYVRKNYDEEDNPVLTVVDFNEDGIESETDYPIDKILDFLANKKKESTTDKPKIETLYDDSKLHELPYQEIMARVKKNGASIVDEPTLGVIKEKASEYWDNISDEKKLSGDWDIVSGILPGLNKKQMMSFLRHFGITCNEDRFSSTSKEWFKMVYSDKFQSGRKLMASSEYLINIGDKTFTDALHESAKNWSEMELHESVDEFTEDITKFHNNNELLPDYVTEDSISKTNEKITGYISDMFKTLPYDLLTDILTSSRFKGGINFLTDTSKMGSIGAYSSSNNSLYLTRAYSDTIDMDNKGIDSSGIGFDWTKEKDGRAPSLPPLSQIVLHEFGHAVDYYLRGETNKSDNKIARWDTGKYVSPDMKTSVSKSFMDNVMKSNKKKRVGFVPTGGTDANGNPSGYYYMKDNWLNPYEGRLYNVKGSFNKNSDGTFSLTETSNYRTGHEHWAENFERVMNSVMHYKKDNESFDVDSYISHITEAYNSRTLAEGEVLPRVTQDNVHFRAGAVLNSNPVMFDTLKKLFIRGNFKED